jgi:DNA-binding NtrC family response regulator
MTRSYKILLIEDDTAFRSVVVKFLGVNNAIETAANLKEATKALNADTFDIVILDKGLPDGDGIGLIPEIKKKTPATAIIVVTADVEFNSVTKCILAGADDYVIKSDNTVPELFVRIPVVINNVQNKLKNHSGLAPDLNIPRNLADLTPESYQTFMQNAERAYLAAALVACQGDAALVARTIGIGKSTIFKKISELGIDRRSRPRPQLVEWPAESGIDSHQ